MRTRRRFRLLREPAKRRSLKVTCGCTDKRRRGAPIVLYEYQPDRKSRTTPNIFKRLQRLLACNGYDGYHNLTEHITVVGCWAHVRRKFDEALKALSQHNGRENSLAPRWETLLRQVFELERESFRTLSPRKTTRKAFRNLQAAGGGVFHMGRFIECHAQIGRHIAARYAFSQRKYLERYLDDGRLEISNKPCRALN